jgi:hypothetical protein
MMILCCLKRLWITSVAPSSSQLDSRTDTSFRLADYNVSVQLAEQVDVARSDILAEVDSKDGNPLKISKKSLDEVHHLLVDDFITP